MLINISDNYGHLNRTDSSYTDFENFDVVNSDLDDILVDEKSVEAVTQMLESAGLTGYTASLANDGVWSGQNEDTAIWNGKEVSEETLIKKIGVSKLADVLINDGYDIEDFDDVNDLVGNRYDEALKLIGMWA